MNLKQTYLAIALAAASFLSLGWADNWEGIKSGAAGIKSIRADFVQEKHMKILMVTSHADRDTVITCIQAECNDYILKPFEKEVVMGKMRKLGFCV